MPGGLNVAEDYLIAVATGGHTTMVIKQCTTQFWYLGHRIRGSMGDGDPDNETESVLTLPILQQLIFVVCLQDL